LLLAVQQILSALNSHISSPESTEPDVLLMIASHFEKGSLIVMHFSSQKKRMFRCFGNPEVALPDCLGFKLTIKRLPAVFHLILQRTVHFVLCNGG
jgi:hypothetical protein